MDRGSRGAAWAGPGARLTAAMGGGCGDPSFWPGGVSRRLASLQQGGGAGLGPGMWLTALPTPDGP